MSTKNHDLAAVLLGAAAGFAAYEHIKTQEAQQQIKKSLRAKFHQFKDEAAKSSEHAKTYFEDLQVKAANLFQENFPDLLGSLEAVMETPPADIISDSPTTEVNPSA